MRRRLGKVAGPLEWLIRRNLLTAPVRVRRAMVARAISCAGSRPGDLFYMPKRLVHCVRPGDSLALSVALVLKPPG